MSLQDIFDGSLLNQILVPLSLLSHTRTLPSNTVAITETKVITRHPVDTTEEAVISQSEKAVTRHTVDTTEAAVLSQSEKVVTRHTVNVTEAAALSHNTEKAVTRQTVDTTPRVSCAMQ